MKKAELMNIYETERLYQCDQMLKWKVAKLFPKVAKK